MSKDRDRSIEESAQIQIPCRQTKGLKILHVNFQMVEKHGRICYIRRTPVQGVADNGMTACSQVRADLMALPLVDAGPDKGMIADFSKRGDPGMAKRIIGVRT
jgi:hypothetical protein